MCTQDEVVCDGACVPEVNNCGTCGNDCVAVLGTLPANAHAECDDGECKIECDDDYELCNGECMMESEFNTDDNCGCARMRLITEKQ